jgi:hypothetical protein
MLVQNRKYRIGGYRAGQRPDNTQYHHAGRFGDEQLPPKVDLRKYMTDVEEQVGNSCVANAFVGAYEYLAKRSLGSAGDISRLFVYYNARAQAGCQSEDGGTEMSCAIDSLIEYGACSEEFWPNDEALLCEEPHADAYEHAANFKIVESEFVETDLNLWRHTLAEGHPIAFALNTFESFDDATRNRGRVSLPKKSDNVRETHGWHAMLCVGYSDKDRMFIVRNSWGLAWGEQGYCYIPYDYVMHQDYNAHDSWIIKSVSDLDFSAEVWEDEASFFADEESLLLYDFYVRTQDPEGFIEDLDALCQNYVESEEDYYFDYEEEEDEETFIVNVLNFDLTIDESDEFLEELDTLCQNYAIAEDYDFNLDSEIEEEEGHSEEYEEESDVAESEEDESDEEEGYNESDAVESEEEEGYGEEEDVAESEEDESDEEEEDDESDEYDESEEEE